MLRCQWSARWLYIAYCAASLVLALTLVGAPGGTAWAHPPDKPPSPLPAGAFIPGRVLVKFKPSIGAAAAHDRLAEQGLRASGVIPGLDVFKVEVPPGRELETIAQLRARADVLYAEPDYRVYALDTVPNDPDWGSQWGLSKIQAPKAWDILSTTGGANIIIAIIDSGIDLDHPDFVCSNKLLPGRDFVNNDNDPQDDYGHGTHVAGIAAACTNNEVGVAGVAWAARLLPVKVLDAVGSGSYSNLADGIGYAVDNGARIINLSLGGTTDSSIMRDAVSYAVSHGRVVVAAAGNCAVGGSGCNGQINPVMYPAAYDEVIAVAATDSGDSHAYFSEYRPYVDVAAPGVGIYSTMYSTMRNNSYDWLDGTSMATAFVSGLAALLWSADGGLSASQVRALIESNADDLGTPGKDDYFGYGRINAWRTLSARVRVNASPTQLTSLADAEKGPVPAQQLITLTTPSMQPITWTATITPPVSWLSIAGVPTGNVSAAASATLTLSATRPITYGTYHATLVITSTTAIGARPLPVTVGATFHYVPQLYQVLLFPIMKNATLP
ncbi:MAG: S8 family peptidase [Anaerolineae bacterium]